MTPPPAPQPMTTTSVACFLGGTFTKRAGSFLAGRWPSRSAGWLVGRAPKFRGADRRTPVEDIGISIRHRRAVVIEPTPTPRVPGQSLQDHLDEPRQQRYRRA